MQKLLGKFWNVHYNAKNYKTEEKCLNNFCLVSNRNVMHSYRNCKSNSQILIG